MNFSTTIRNFIRKITPEKLLDSYRKKKKKEVNKALQKQKEAGEGVSKALLDEQLQKMGIVEGDVLLVHSALSKMGFVEGGPQTVIKSLLDAVGASGHILMPSSPNPARQLDFVKSNPVFDVNETPSKMGAITETFRKMDGVVRSLHPTEPVCVFGPDADNFINEHFGEPTPYTSKSPWYKLMEAGGKILYAGVTLDNAGTNLHTLEDAVDFPYSVYTKERFTINMINEKGEKCTMETVVHNPLMSDKRQCDGLLPMFEAAGVMQRVSFGKAPALLFDAKRMFEVMKEQFQTNNITMYTPKGEKLDL